jgi:hypothetical protein
MYAFLLDHDEKFCESLVKVVSVIFAILVRSPFCFISANVISLFGILAVLASVCLHHTSMGIHWGKTPNTLHLYTLLTGLRLYLVLVFVARNGPLQARIYGTWKDRLFQGFPSWI